MDIGQRLRSVREEKKLSQGDIEERTGLLRCYISRVENGHTVPAIKTLEKVAQAMGIPLYELLYDGDKPPQGSLERNRSEVEWGSFGKDARFLNKVRGFLARMREDDRELLLRFLGRLSKRRREG